jgi:hypothetical protein
MFNAFVDRGTMTALSRLDTHVWVAMFRHARPDRTVRVSAGRLAETLGVCRQTIVRSLRRLRDARLLIRARRGGPGGHVTIYKIRAFDPNRPTSDHADI